MVLTGTGLVSPAGTGVDDLFRCLREQKDRQAELDPGQLLKHLNLREPKLKIARYTVPASKNAVVAIGAAMTDSRLDASQIAVDPYGHGIVLGTTRGACLTRENLYDSFASRRGKALSGTIFSHCGYNIAGAMAAVAYGIRGPNLTVAGRPDLGIAILRRVRQIMVSRRAHTVFAGFTECNGTLRRADGLFGEWAYALCLERKDRAVERGATLLAEVFVEPVDAAAPQNENDVLCGSTSCHSPLKGNGPAIALDWPSRRIFCDRYASLILIGLLSHDRSLRKRFAAIAFTTYAGKSPIKVQVQYGGEENQCHDP